MQIRTSILSVTVAAIIGVAGMAGAMGLASAQQPTPTPKHEQRMQRRDDLLGKVAAKLNVTLDQLKQAFKSTATQAVDDALASGDITQAQADAAKAKLESGDGFALRRILGARQLRKGAIAARVRAGIVKSAATALSLTPADLRTQLKSGKSIAEVAGPKLADVKTQITTDAKTKLDAAVTANKLTQENADNLLQKLTDSLDKILNKTRGQAKTSTTP